ncbi:(2Fe-2S)-binding protein [Hydrogenophaga sp. 2FB]|uniref:(2Fe-2S)-binding protein n=1 Tax=Hydrogenophaga sp. 2FB TaxID=2502187 RepID=UPI0010F943B0|nr:(2Fe-2S)-binding protein [Hydrogenophaga sp. 2FB]
MSVDISLSVNGQAVRRAVAPQRLLITLLREDLGLTGTHPGCDTAQCGACTVLLDGAAVKSCNVLAVQADGASVTTVEGLAPADGPLHPMQRAFGQHHALQCGYCTPGMVMRAVAMDREGVPAEPGAVCHALSGNLCRCTGYYGIVKAACQGLREMRDGREGGA